MSGLVSALLVGVLFATGVHQLLQRTLLRAVFGLALIGHAVNLLIFLGAGVVRGRAPLVASGATAPPADAADPVPQALVLTAIVIGFALVAFAAVLVRTVVERLGSDDGDRLPSSHVIARAAPAARGNLRAARQSRGGRG